MTVTVPQEFLNALAAAGIGDGIEVEEFRNVFQLPMMGPIELSVGMTIVEVSFQMRSGDDGRFRATVRATGDIRFHGDSPMPAFPGLARVAGDVLVRPVIELRPDGSFVAVLDLPAGEVTDMRFEGVDGVAAADDAIAMMSQMLFAAVGEDLYRGLAENLGHVGIELDAAAARGVVELGIAAGPAEIRVSDGVTVVGFPAVDGHDGHAAPVPAHGRRVGVGLARGSLTPAVARLAAATLGRALPFHLEFDTEGRRIGGRVRSTRLVDTPLIPDLRPGLRYSVTPRLRGEEIHVTLREAWLELPLVPGMVNQLNRWIGASLASRASWSFTLPAVGELPVRPDSERSMRVAVVRLDVDDDGVAAIIDTDL